LGYDRIFMNPSCPELFTAHGEEDIENAKPNQGQTTGIGPRSKSQVVPINFESSCASTTSVARRTSLAPASSAPAVFLSGILWLAENIEQLQRRNWNR
jgi:hypothetical protein